MRSIAISVVALIALGTAACSNDEADVLVGTLERDRLELIAEANEPIVAVGVREGDKVAAGARLLVLGTQTAQARLEQAQAAVNVAERRLAELVKGPRAQEIQEARAALEAAASAERTATNEFERVHDLVERRLLSQSELDAVRAQRDAAVSQHRQARARLDLLLEGTRREEIEQAQAELERARAVLTEVETSFTRHTVVAPRASCLPTARPTPGSTCPRRGARRSRPDRKCASVSTAPLATTPAPRASSPRRRNSRRTTP